MWQKCPTWQVLLEKATQLDAIETVASLVTSVVRHLRRSIQTNTNVHRRLHAFFLFRPVGSGSDEGLTLGRSAQTVLEKVRRGHGVSLRLLITYLSTAVRFITGVVIEDIGFFRFIEFVWTSGSFVITKAEEI